MATIRKRGERYQVQVRRQGAPSITRSFRLKQDALQWARTIEAEIDRGEFRPERKQLDSFSFRDLIIRYRDEITPRKKVAANETVILNALLKRSPRLCALPLSAISKAHFAHYRDERLKKVLPATLRRELNIIRHLFNVAEAEWNIPLRSNPVKGLSIPGCLDNRRDRRLQAGEEAALFASLRCSRNPIIEDVVLFALQTGMRRAEIICAKIRDLDANRETLRIPETKNGTPRVIPLSDEARSLAIKVAADRPADAQLFATTVNAIKLAWKRALKRTTISDLHFHDLRHEAVSRFFEKGLTTPEVAMISGHRDPRMLFRYTHPDPYRVRQKL